VNKQLNILICPLEWGLGHAARMIPLAAILKEMGHNIIIASGDEHSALFRNDLPGLSYIKFPGFKPSYSRFLPQYISLLFKIPSLLFHIVREHRQLDKIISHNRIDIVISDNRFGLWNNKIRTVYVTHMPRIPFPSLFRFLEPVGIVIHRAIIRKYSYCWIPDLPGEENLSGRLSHSLNHPPNTRFIGLLSRFTLTSGNDEYVYSGKTYNTVILSGPEPQRGILKQKLIPILEKITDDTFILEGKPLGEKQITDKGNIHLLSHLPAAEMSKLIRGSRSIITRSGYTTIMELISLQSGALIIPTPGQTEQEYLAGYLSLKGWFKTVSQKNLDEKVNLPDNRAIWPADLVLKSKLLLTSAIGELLIDLHKD
jgi:spore coat polysaccharide biosynthesis predicted glycosyltransferase SpsG